jgi:hypothetical protein
MAWMVQFSEQMLPIATGDSRFEEFAIRFSNIRCGLPPPLTEWAPAQHFDKPNVNTEIFRIILPAAVHLVHIDDREH